MKLLIARWVTMPTLFLGTFSRLDFLVFKLTNWKNQVESADKKVLFHSLNND